MPQERIEAMLAYVRIYREQKDDPLRDYYAIFDVDETLPFSELKEIMEDNRRWRKLLAPEQVKYLPPEDQIDYEKVVNEYINFLDLFSYPEKKKITIIN